MSKIIQHKRSSVAGNQPTNSQVAIGEIAINFADRSVFTQDGSNVVTELSRDVIRSATEPSNPLEGDIWYDTVSKEMYFYDGTSFQDIATNTGAPGAPVDPSNITSVPAFVSGTGDSSDPFIINPVDGKFGDQNTTLATITISNLDSDQPVAFQDLNSSTNADRFTISNSTANPSGVLSTNIIFSDNPTTTSPTTYSGQMKFGSSSVFINCDVELTLPLEGGSSINNPDGTGTGTNLWNGSDGSTLTASGDLLLSNDGINFSTSISVDKVDIYYLKWKGDPGSGTGIDGAHGTTITGTVSDNSGGSLSTTLTIDKETTFEFQTGVDSDQILSSVSTSDTTTLTGINSYVYPFGSSTGTLPEY